MKFIVVVNRGGLKIFRFSQDAQGSEGPHEELLQSVNVPEVEEHLSKKVTDQADRFRRWGSTAEKGHVDLENERRAVIKLANLIASFLRKKYLPDGAQWDLAVPAEIHAELIEALDPILKKRLRHVLKKDLMKCSPKDVLMHF